MLPRIKEQETIDKITKEFLNQLKRSGFSGDINQDYASRLTCSTDNSIYQVLPQSILFPRSGNDITKIMRLSNQRKFQKIKLGPRGGGTGTNGQSLTSGIVVDLSKYMNQIIEINTQETYVKVQPGVILDQLNRELERDGFFFAPTLSPGNRATLGGMVNTDACGKGSRIYGRTSNHVVALSLVFTDGTPWTSESLDKNQLLKVKSRNDIVGKIYQLIDEVAVNKKEAIEKQFPKLKRFLTGYNLAHLYTQNGRFNLNSLICGSEGTLAIVTEIKLKLTKIPKYKKLVVVKYLEFDHALSDARNLLKIAPSAIETIDSTVLNLGKKDVIWSQVGPLLIKEDQNFSNINLVEFIEDSEELINNKLDRLKKSILLNSNSSQNALGMYIAKNEIESNNLWDLRKKGVGLLGNKLGSRKPIPFVEDTAVPPENLANYIKEFRDLLDRHKLEYGMFGHVDVGCLHVRPALDIKDPKDEILLKKISDGVLHLVKKYGGVIWAEHGKGYRSEYNPEFFGEELHHELRRIKQVFDPKNQLNPGKIVTPLSSKENIPKINEPGMRGHFDRQIPEQVRDTFAPSMNCNGNGLCFNFDPHHIMCPSSKVTKDRIHSPKGRAGILREWLRLLSTRGFFSDGELQERLAPQPSFNPIRYLSKIGNTLKKSLGVYDFSNEVYQAMSGCLSCKACATQCPINVDVPEFKARFLDMYHSRYLRPILDFFVGEVEWIAHKSVPVAGSFNMLQNSIVSKLLLKHLVGMVDAPLFSIPTLKQNVANFNLNLLVENQYSELKNANPNKTVILLQDAFTSFYDVDVVTDISLLIRHLGYQVFIAPYKANGKPSHVKGKLNRFRKIAHNNLIFLNTLSKFGVPIVGVDPSIVLTYREEYKTEFGNQLKFQVMLLQEWMKKNLTAFQSDAEINKNSEPFVLFGHCTEKTGAIDSQKQWQNIFRKFGLNMELISVGCCGMAGTFGHETKHHDESKAIFEMSWQKKLLKINHPDMILATGYSCRTQVKRFGGFKPKHPAQPLLKSLLENDTSLTALETFH